MQKIRRNNIYLTRGDTLFVKVTPILSNGKEYALKKGDVITFTVKKTTGDDDDILIQRTTENGIIIITPCQLPATEVASLRELSHPNLLR